MWNGAISTADAAERFGQSIQVCSQPSLIRYVLMLSFIGLVLIW